jgi:hypothetical protein
MPKVLIEQDLLERLVSALEIDLRQDTVASRYAVLNEARAVLDLPSLQEPLECAEDAASVPVRRGRTSHGDDVEGAPV